MTIYTASIYDKLNHHGQLCCTAVKPMAEADCWLDFLAPTLELRNGHKYHKRSDQWYQDGYRKLMSERQAQVMAWLQGLKADENLTLLCYCTEGRFCHRRIIATMVKYYRPDLIVEVH